MPTVFTRIMNGELPGRFVWEDEHCVAFLSIAPLAPGHVLVVPRSEVDHWIDASEGLLAHLVTVSRRIGNALQAAFAPMKVGLMIAGLEVPHLHIHLVPISAVHDLDFTNADPAASAEDLDDAAARIIDALAGVGSIESG